jgi:hypothetical protein
LRFNLYDVDNFKENIPLSKHTLVGEAFFMLKELLQDNFATKEFSNPYRPKFKKMLESKRA